MRGGETVRVLVWTGRIGEEVRRCTQCTAVSPAVS